MIYGLHAYNKINYEKHDYMCLRHGLAGEVIKAII